MDRTGRMVFPVIHFLLLSCLVPGLPFRALAGEDPSSRSLMLWNLEKDGRRATLLGSVHLADDSLYPLPGLMEQAFERTDAVVFEVNPDELGPDFQRKMFEAGKLPEGRRLSGLIDAGTMGKLKLAMDRNMVSDDVEGYEPWYVALLMTFAELSRNTGHAFTTDLGIDRHFMRKAKTAGKSIRGLESAGDQLQLLDALDHQAGAELLEQTLDELNNIKEEARTMLDLWRRGDAEALWKLVEENFRDYPSLYQHWLVARNRRWAETIVRMMEEENGLFIVVGAAHLAGPDGLPELLRRRGFEVRQEQDTHPHRLTTRKL